MRVPNYVTTEESLPNIYPITLDCFFFFVAVDQIYEGSALGNFVFHFMKSVVLILNY